MAGAKLSRLASRLFHLTVGGSAAIGISCSYHVYNRKQPPETIDWNEQTKNGIIGGLAFMLAKNPSIVISELPRSYNALLERFPMATKSITTGVTYVLGDLVAQLLEREKGEPLDYTRMAVFMAYGVAIAGPLYTLWFDRIDKLPYMIYNMKQEGRRQHIEGIVKYAAERGVIIPAEIAKTPELHRVTFIGSKVLADQLVFSSAYTCVFFLGVGLISGKTMEDSWGDVRKKFIPTYATDCAVWPLLQMVNFTMVPSQYRVLFVNVANIAWNAFLSYMANASNHHSIHSIHNAPAPAIATESPAALATESKPSTKAKVTSIHEAQPALHLTAANSPSVVVQPIAQTVFNTYDNIRHLLRDG